jgi:K+-sensing histidine kinase KdpD
MPTDLNIPNELDLVVFVSKQAHDLKSPFNRIMGFIKLVLKGLDGPISGEARSDLDTAYENSQAALNYMNGLVEMARLVEDEHSLELSEYDLNDLLQQAMDDWKKLSHKSPQVEVTYSAPACVVCVDAMMMRRCLFYWIAYVVEFVQQDIQVEILVEQQNEGCLVSVRSMGKKLHPAPECDQEMYGYIARSLVERHGGEILGAVQEDLGCQVRFKLPSPN